MGQVALSLGGVTFQNFEIPEKIALQGGQIVAVHQLIGGGRVIDVLGDDPGRISFSGIFAGTDAVARAQILDAATATGAQLPLFWDSFFYTVIIEEFSADYAKPWWIPFSLTCLVVIDPVAVIAATVASAADLIASDVASAIGFSGQAGVSLALSGAATVSALGGAQNVISGGMAAANGALSAGAARLSGATQPSTGISAMMQLVATSSQLAALSSMSGYVNRASSNAAAALL